MSELHNGRVSETAGNGTSAPHFDVLDLLLDSRLVKFGAAAAAAGKIGAEAGTIAGAAAIAAHPNKQDQIRF